MGRACIVFIEIVLHISSDIHHNKSNSFHFKLQWVLINDFLFYFPLMSCSGGSYSAGTPSFK